MIRSYTGRKRFRKFFGKVKEKTQLPDLIALQKNSYDAFLQKNIPHEQRENKGLLEVFNSFFPIKDNHGKTHLEFCGYYFDESKYSEIECKKRGGTFSAALRGKFRLVMWDIDPDTHSRTIKDIREQDVYLGDIPLMTESGTFIFNGIERVVVSQMHRSPGVFFDHDHGKGHSSGKYLYVARVIPYRGSWIDFEFDHRDVLYVRIDRRRKVLASTFLMCLESAETTAYKQGLQAGEDVDENFVTGMSKEEILNYFYDSVKYQKNQNGWKTAFVKENFKGGRLEKDLVNADTNEVVAKSGTKLTPRIIDQLESNGLEFILVDNHGLLGKYIAKEFVDDFTGKIYFEAGEEITEEILENFSLLGLDNIEILFTNNVNVGSYMMNTFACSKCLNRQDALVELSRALVPGEPATVSSGEDLLNSMIFDSDRYDLSAVGRAKINDKLGLTTDDSVKILQKRDILEIIKTLFAVKDGKSEIDDIDNLGNRRVRSVGELVENQCRLGMIKMERVAKEKMASAEGDSFVPSDLINAKPLMTTVKDFFISSQLSQFMDQTNPLSEVTHKRRLSALGPGGLSRERAGFEVRDVHSTHYSRLCPIETPEGQNIGLISSLACYAKINRYGFIEAPYKKVVNGKITSDIDYLTATEEVKFSIGQADVPRESDGTLIGDFLICRTEGGGVIKKPKLDVAYIDVSPKQVVSVAAALIPFIENDEASRALMGSNMQRQAVPLLRCDAPLVGTGMESVIAKDSGSSVIAKRSGIVDYVDAKRIVVRVTEEADVGADVYNLSKFQCSNMGTCINQKPIVKVGDVVKVGDIVADGPSTDLGELALGKNMLVAFMSWHGYSFEDSIILSERVAKEDILTSIHIDSFEATARDTKLGNEEITRDIHSISEESLRNLDESGIVYVGAEVRPGDILVGKVTPKGETPMTPEEKLLRAIFGEKSADVRDTSLRVPPGTFGTVVEVRVLVRKGVEKDERTIAIERQLIDDLAKDMESEKRIFEQTYFKHIFSRIVGETLVSGLFGIQNGALLTNEMVKNLSYYQVKNIQIDNADVQAVIDTLVQQFDEKFSKLQKSFEENVAKLRKGDDLPPGVLKMVKVFVANKKKIQPGDKMAGRHGNKGVVSKIVPVEDMPYLADGTPIDIILNPLGLPSRMNVGQILETNFGAAAKGLGQQIQKMLDEYKKQQASMEELKQKVLSMYSDQDDIDDISALNENELLELAKNLSNGVPFATPVFDGANLSDIENHLTKAGLNSSGQVDLYDGRTGLLFDRKVTVGYKYILKLHHLVDDKIHARSVGPYSLITQQPLGGKAQFGGQRFGEMEVWALEGYGASHILREMLTVKSDDVKGRTKVYESIVRGENEVNPEIPESFNVLMKELRSLGLNLSLENTSNKEKNEI